MSSYSGADSVAWLRRATSSERLRGHPGLEITVVSRENFFVITPLLFEACSGRLELRHCAQPIRAALRRARFVEATVERVDVERQIVRAVAAEGATYDLPYDHLVVALGASTNEQLIPGSSNAFTFKTMADALVLRNHLIEQFERADATLEPTTRRGCLTVIVIGGGLVGVELLGELSAFADDVLRFYPRLQRDEVRFLLFEAGARVLPEIDEELAVVAARVLRRRGADIRVSTPVRSIETRSCARRKRDHRRGHDRAGGGNRAERRRHVRFPSCTINVAGLRSMRRCGVAATRMSGRWATAPRFPDRMAVPIQRSRSTPSGRHDTSRATSMRRLKGASRPRSCSTRSEPWPRSVTRAPLRGCSACG